MKTYRVSFKVGISRSPEFEKKLLATHAVNVGLKCSHACRYCSSPSVLRTHRAFKAIGRTAFEEGFCIVDPDTPERIRRDAKRLTTDNTVMLCTLTDAWAPESRRHDLGRRCLEVLLEESSCQVRVLTKSASVRKDFSLMARYTGRVTVGLSVSASPDRARRAQVLAPFASPIPERVDALMEAHRMGLRTFGMVCPVLPGVADTPEVILLMLEVVLEAGVEDIWVEPVNPRGPGLKRCEEALRKAGLSDEAAAFHKVRHKPGWNDYAARLVRAAQHAAERLNILDKLHVLLYEAQFDPTNAAQLKSDSRGLVWLKKDDGRTE